MAKSYFSDKSLSKSLSMSDTRILLVDDDQEILEELTDILESEGFCVDMTTDPVTALAMVKFNKEFSVIITDLSMPGLTGLEMIDEMYATLCPDRDLEVIVLTGQADTKRAVEALRLGAVDFLFKPTNVEILIHATNRAVELVRMKRNEREFRMQLEHRVMARTKEVQKLSDDLLATNNILKIRNMELEASTQIKSEFLSLISHELRTPLNHIIGFSSLLKMSNEEVGKSEDVSYIQKILDGGNDLLNMVDIILDVINIDGKNYPLSKKAFDLTELVTSMCGIVKPKAEKSGVNILLDLESSPTIMFADKRRMTQVIGNVLDNVIRFANNSGTAIVAAYSTDNDTIISIADKGVGMTKEQINIAKQPFRQLDSKLSRTAYGMGLGLTLSKLIVEQHDGIFSVDSVLGEGTVVTIAIPRQGCIA
jgi:signal transduction histidine kinase